MSKVKNSDFKYGEFYKEIKLIPNDLSVPKEGQDWILTNPKGATPHEVVLYPRVQRTAHIPHDSYRV